MMGAYREGDAVRVIFMKSDDGGQTWSTPAGDASYREGDCERWLLLKSTDDGESWGG
jgi:hypothetical protein